MDDNKRLRVVIDAVKRGDVWTVMREAEREFAEFPEFWSKSVLRPFVQGLLAAILIWTANSLLHGPPIVSILGMVVMCVGIMKCLFMLWFPLKSSCKEDADS